MSTYQVTRDFAGHTAGTVLRESDLLNRHRAAQLISQRYLTPLASGDMQPTVAMLLGATARKLAELMPQVQDACVLETALAQETRESARKTLQARLQEMTDAESTH